MRTTPSFTLILMWLLMASICPRHIYAVMDTPPAQLVITCSDEDYVDKVHSFFRQPFELECITFDSDVYMQSVEFFYLTDLREGMTVTSYIMQQAISYLIKKNKFETITCTLTEGTKGKSMHIALSGFWTFAKVVLHGIVIGKDRYKHHYLFESGEPFDERKHQLSLEKLQQLFMSEGYFNATVTTRFVREHTTKSITVHLTVHLGERFSIKNVDVIIRPHSDIPAEDIQKFVDELRSRPLRRLGRSYYNKKLLTREARSLKRYLAKKGFFHIGLELQETLLRNKRRVNLVFILDIHRKKSFTFIGNQFFTDDQLFDMVYQFGSAVSLLPPTVIVQEVEKEYRRKGFYQVTCTATECEDSYTFTIKQGQRRVVSKVTLKKVNIATSAQLVKKYFTELLHHTYFDEDVLHKAIESMLSWYQEQGYLDASILKQEFIDNEDGGHELVLTVQEGAQSYVNSVTIPEFSALEDQGPFLLYKWAVQPVPFTAAFVQEQQRWLINYFQALGHKHVHTKPEYTRNGEHINLVWIITMLTKGNFGKTVLQGSTTFPFEYIIRELRYEQGQAWDQQELKKSLLGLRALDVFESVHLYPYDVTTVEPEKAVLLKAQKDDMFEIRMRTGFAWQQVSKELRSAGLTYRLGGTFCIKNPFNCGDQICLDGNVAQSQRTVTVSYRCPWLFGVPVRTIVQGYMNKNKHPGFLHSERNLYDATQQGISFDFSRKYEHITSSVNLGIELMRTRVSNQRLAEAINFEPDLVNQKFPYFLIEPTLMIDYLDNKLQPTKGSFTLLTVKGMLPFTGGGARTYFIRFLAEQSVFIPLASSVLALRLRFGHIFHRCFAAVMPTERFYAGGANSIRGYETDYCPPLGKYINDKGCVQFVPQGGKSIATLNIELRFALFKQLGGVIFQDFGVLSGKNIFYDCSLSRLLAATGFGLRYTTPIGPLRFDIGWKWHCSNPTVRRYSWFLAVGQAF